ncbi:MAG: tRNA (adenosine(37)-N6)-threonylcarbamoyltransferase complex dimerization subunit type 1 TsaB, partial [Firmicutes bacterium]|nr:tRNA (adenosine(37)-N6)-threonylcarbamoyltransferase complex dimerization subunit type 1 TsaB [Bacillota bacterium]
KLYYQTSSVAKNTMSLLLPICDQLIGNANTNLNELDTFGVCVGPGSFTGLRVGIGTIKAFAQVLDKPIITVTTNQLNAYNVSNDVDKTIASCVDGGSSVCFVALYQGNIVLQPPTCISKLELHKWLSLNQHSYLITDFSIGDIPTSNLIPNRILMAMKNTKDIVDYQALQPLYIRQPQVLRKIGEV